MSDLSRNRASIHASACKDTKNNSKLKIKNSKLKKFAQNMHKRSKVERCTKERCTMYEGCKKEGEGRRYLHSGGKEGGITKDVEDIFGGGNEKCFALFDAYAVDVGFSPKADNNHKRVSV